MSHSSAGSGESSAALDSQTRSLEGRPQYQEVTREAPITEVVIHARGAVVTRRMQVYSDDPEETFRLVCSGVTLSAEPGSVRCVVDAGRTLRSVTSRTHVPEKDSSGPSTEKVDDIDRKIARINDEHGVLARRLDELHGARISPTMGRSLRENGAGSRLSDTFEIASVIDERMKSTIERLAELETEHRRLSREREVAALELAQDSSEQARGDGAPTREFCLLFGPGSSEGYVDITYVVRAARWWPAYTLRVEEDGRAALLVLEANVAQDTGEDWSNVQLGLATSELVSEVQLPRLPSYRLGRAQPDPPRAFRPPPKGVERLFLAYDMAFGAGPAPSAPAAAPAPYAPPPPSAPPEPEMSFDADEEVSWDAIASQASFGSAELMDEARAQPMMSRASMMPQKKSRKRSAKPAPLAEMAVGGAPPGAGGGGVPTNLLGMTESNLVEPGEGWLDFDSVVLAAPSSSQRGKLKRRAASSSRSGSLGEAEERARTMGVVDPMVSRGHFDHRYDSQARIDVPSDGALHRVEISAASCPASLSWRTNPREDSAVYREVSLDNPFPSPLLAGPLDVYVRGSLVSNTDLTTVGRGGTMTAGLGVDDRIRVARNARVREESAGLLGGKREIDHFIDIELASSLGFDAVVEVIDRIPVSRDEHVEVEMFESVPKGESYDQSDRDAPVEGGHRWRVDVIAGQNATIRFAYRIKLRSKDELEGGNRRD